MKKLKPIVKDFQLFLSEELDGEGEREKEQIKI